MSNDPIADLIVLRTDDDTEAPRAPLNKTSLETLNFEGDNTGATVATSVADTSEPDGFPTLSHLDFEPVEAARPMPTGWSPSIQIVLDDSDEPDDFRATDATGSSDGVPLYTAKDDVNFEPQKPGATGTAGAVPLGWTVGGIESEPATSNTAGLTSNPDPVGGIWEPEQPEISIINGTEDDDVILFDANHGDLGPHTNGTDVYLKGGDDLLIRDRTGNYGYHDGLPHNNMIWGGSGEDTIDYSMLTSRIEADLTGWGGFGSIQQKVAPWQQPYAFDRTTGIENIIATKSHDVVEGDGADNKFWGLNGNDDLFGLGGSDELHGGNGNDFLDGGSGSDKLFGGDQDDTINGGTGHDQIDGGSGSDTIDGGMGNDTIEGGTGNDTIDGGIGNGIDTIYGGDGNDTIDGGGGDDIIHVGGGNDTVTGGFGKDEIHISGFGDNTVDGGAGSDTVVFDNASTEVNLIFGTAWRSDGTDRLTGIENVTTGSGVDTVFGNSGVNHIKTGGGSDTIYSAAGDDHVEAGDGDDYVVGGTGSDDVFGDAGDDFIFGGDGVDVLMGGDGNDTIRGGTGDDIMLGNGDADTFLWETGDTGYDEVFGFDLGEDMLAFGEGFFQTQPDGSVDLPDVLWAWNLGNDTALVANTAANGWQALAVFHGTDAAEFSQRIENGTILNVEVSDVGQGGPGGFDTASLGQIDFGFDFII
ncbi:calcium-binding protein [Roseibium sp. Sym1]|uniref:calcium-binding protein n=1 Tax=Roseibium sp. Sym1 TaxID=3016006 RepID=UPI0022B4EC1D|nr:calcium-binding protein [Roseibium sp. Sym1]